MAQDGQVLGISYTTSDRYCLMGQRLIVISGSYGQDGAVYHTEIEGFGKVISHGTVGSGSTVSPAWFELHTKSGQIMEFGNTADSQMLATNGSGVVRAWAVNKVGDTKGNYFTVTYGANGAGNFGLPLEIDYTGNSNTSMSPYNKVTFSYVAIRPDPSYFYQAGSYLYNVWLLSDIDTYQGSNLVSDYKLTYAQGTATARSHLASLTICDSSGTNCLPATTFGWSDAGTATNPISWGQSSSSVTVPSLSSEKYIVGDFNGDGKTDYAVLETPSTGASSVVLYLGNGDGTFTRGTSFTLPSGMGSPPFLPADFNGNGLTGFTVNGGVSGSSEKTSYYTNTPSGWVTTTTSPNANPYCTYSTTTFEGDFNGDGRADFNDKKSASPGTRYTCLGTGNGTFTNQTQAYPTSAALYGFVGDVNGDGKTDQVFIYSTSIVSYIGIGAATSTTVTQTVPTVPSGRVLVSGDFNGDGLTDFALLTTNSITVYLAKGDGTFDQRSTQTDLTVPNPASGSYDIVTGDFNGDGRTDFAMFNGNQVYTYRSLGTGRFDSSYQLINFTMANTVALTGDFDGDGKTDVVFNLYRGASPNILSTYFHSQGGMPDLMTSITTGAGANTTITYLPLTNTSVYTKGTGATYPQMDFIGAMYVVSAVAASNGVGGTYNSTYSYLRARIDLSGRGFLGFLEATVADSQTGIFQGTIYFQDFPCTGTVYVSQKQLGSQLLNSNVNAQRVVNASGGSSTSGLTCNASSVVSTPSNANAPYIVEAQQTNTNVWDLDGSSAAATTATYTYDSYGNTTQMTVSMPDGATKTTTNTYTNDTTNWYLGRLTGSTVTSTTP